MRALALSSSLPLALVFLLTIVALPTDPASASESARALSAEALEECHKGRVAQAREVRLTHFERGRRLAERAVALDDEWADGHFALFCTLGEKMRLDGEILGSLFGFHKILGALDRTLELDPDHLDALSCKGTFLIRLPGLFGGDRDKGEEMLRRVIQRAPDRAVNARLVLARSYADQGHIDQALDLANKALRIAYALDREDLIPKARATVAELSPKGEAAPFARSLMAHP